MTRPSHHKTPKVRGESIYNLTLDIATHLYLTVVHATINGDTLFPKFDINQWVLTQDEKHAADKKNQYAHSFRLYERAASQSY